MTKVDQIMVRNVGGWNLISEDEWYRLAANERLKLVTSQSVQFFNNGVEVDTMVALESLALEDPTSIEKSKPIKARQTEEVAPGPRAKSDDAIELAAARRSNANYTRLVIAGPSWQVQQSRPDTEGIPFYEVRNRESDDAYDLTNPSGLNLLMSDLIADVYGIADPIDAILSAEALDYFDTTYFSTDLGDRFWEVSARDIRFQVESNPYIKILSPSKT